MTDSMRDRLRDELTGWPIASGYYSTAVSVDDARDMADALLAAFPWLSDEPTEQEVEAGARALDLHRWDDWSAWADDEAVLVGQAAHRDAARLEARAVLVAAREARTT